MLKSMKGDIKMRVTMARDSGWNVNALNVMQSGTNRLHNATLLQSGGIYM